MPAFVSRTVGDVVSEILMSRTNFSGSFLVLEGDTDSKFWSGRIEKSKCQIVIAGAKPTVEGAVVRADGIPLAGILGIVDDDYDSLCGIPVPSKNILRTDCRDLEVMLLKSAALDKVILEVADAAKIAAFQSTEGTTVRDALVQRSVLFGRLRWLNKQLGWNLDFDNLSPYRFADLANWRIDERAVVDTVAPMVGITVSDLDDALSALDVSDPYLVLHGRDAAAVLAMGLRAKLGSQQHPIDRLCQMLRLAYDDALAEISRLFSSVVNWETLNPPYQILK